MGTRQNAGHDVERNQRRDVSQLAKAERVETKFGVNKHHKLN